MIINLPKDYFHSGDVALYSGDDLAYKLTPVLGGVLLYGADGSLCAQIFFDKKTFSAEITIAEVGSYSVKKSGKICLVDSSAKNSYEVFGNCDNYEYTLYEGRIGTSRTKKGAQVTSDPSQDIYYSVYLNEECDVIRNLLTVVAVNGIVRL